MRVIRTFVLCCLVLTAASAADYTMETGEIGDAAFSIARPAQWNGTLLLLAHGFRPESAPRVADLFPERSAYQLLLRDGWMVAKTSYRRNGTIIHDAIADLDALRAHIAVHFGAPTRVLIEGESMGGLIATLIAERRPAIDPLYHGVVAIAPAFHLRDPDPRGSALTMLPHLPIVFLTTRSETEAARVYTAAKAGSDVERIRPALLRVNRDGHANINQAERLVALRMLHSWLDYGRESLPDPPDPSGFVDVTRIPEALPSRVFLDEDKRGFAASVSEVTRVYGNLLLDVQAGDFRTIGLQPKSYFEVTLRQRSYRVLLGKDFSSVKRGEWVAFENADGFFWLARNGSSAAETAEAQAGDVVHIRRYAETPDAPER